MIFQALAVVCLAAVVTLRHILNWRWEIAGCFMFRRAIVGSGSMGVSKSGGEGVENV